MSTFIIEMENVNLGISNFNQKSASSLDISNDYFWGSSLRTLKLKCQDELLQIICHDKCQGSYECVKDTCYCTKEKPSHINIIEGSWDDVEKLLEAYINKKSVETFELTESPQTQPQTKEVIKEDGFEEDEEIEHPALRHHIAHFCPNLEDARTCIRTCMKVGKPAFCGKDHVCYCGHRYTSHDEAQPLNVDDMYAKFRDLYEKYFGPKESKPKTVK